MVISVNIWYHFSGEEHQQTTNNTTNTTKQQSTKDTNMAIVDNTIPIQQITYVFGKDIESMSEKDLIHAIKQVEFEIDQLSSVKTESVKIALRIFEHKETLQQLVKLLDNK